MITINPFSIEDSAALLEHLQRHFAESGKGDIHFLPFIPNDPERPKGIAFENASFPLDAPGWQRWFFARDTETGKIVGHVDLKNEGLKTILHRCELGIGIERAWRGAGLGKRLMEAAIQFARTEEALSWVDLKVFGHNTRARALYQQLGFTELGVLQDRFRIGADSIDDVVMTLRVK